MKITRKISLVFAAIAVCIGASSCDGTSKTTKGAVIGATAGGIVGGVAADENRKKGAVIGATAGGVAGGLLGRRAEKKEQEQELIESRRATYTRPAY